MTNVKRLAIVVLLVCWLASVAPVVKACCVGDCPDGNCWTTPGGPVSAEILPNDYVRICKRVCSENPAGVDTAEEWWQYLRGVGVVGERYIDAWDYDIGWQEWWDGPNDTDPNSQTEPCGCDYNVESNPFGDGRFKYTWSGSVDLTVEGIYTLTCTITQVPSDPPDPCPALDESTTVALTVEVYTGNWVFHDEPVAGDGDVQRYAYYDPFCDPEDRVWGCSGTAYLPAGGAVMHTVAGQPSVGVPCVISSDTYASTVSNGAWRKLWRWEDWDGTICPCEAEERTFNYAVVLHGIARVSGDADSLLGWGPGGSMSTASASATILLEGSQAQHQVSPPTGVLNVSGVSAEESPSFSWQVGFSGVSLGSDTGDDESYDSGEKSHDLTYGGSAKGGWNMKEVSCTVTTTGSGHSQTTGAAARAAGRAEVRASQFTFE